MGSACSGKANNPAALDRLDVKVTAKQGKKVSFTDPLEQVAPANLGSPRKEQSQGDQKKDEHEEPKILSKPVEIGDVKVDFQSSKNRSPSSDSSEDEQEKLARAQKIAQEEA